MIFRKGIIVDTHPEDNSVDLVLCDTGARLSGVPVLAQNASTRTGSVDLPEVPERAGGVDKWDIRERTGQDMEALVGFMTGNNPFVVGFLFPQISQMTFKDKKRRFNRHQSDVYQTIDGDGNMEIYHPSGAYVRIAEKIEHEDLSDKNFDKNMQLNRNTGKKVSIHVQATDGKSSVTIEPDGVIKLKASSKFLCETPLLEVPSGDVVASGVSLVRHMHDRVQPGAGISGGPIPGLGGSGGSGGGGGGGGGDGPDYNVPEYKYGGTRQKYDQRSSWEWKSPVTAAYDAFKTWMTTFPANKTSVPEPLYYERFRVAQDQLQEGRRVFSDYSLDAAEFTESAFVPWNGQDYFGGAIPHGMLDSNKDGPYPVYTAEDGRRFAIYGGVFCQTHVKSHTSGIGTIGGEELFAIYLLTEEEFQAGKVT